MVTSASCEGSLRLPDAMVRAITRHAEREADLTAAFLKATGLYGPEPPKLPAANMKNTPNECVGWARRQAEKLGLEFNGTPEGIEAMIRNGHSVDGDLFLDFGVSRNVLSRPGLDALIKTAVDDLNVSHVARPDHPMDGIKLEDALRRHGVTIVFMYLVLSPLRRGKRRDIGELIVATVDYRSSEDRRELAQKVLYAQLHLAKLGFSTGGRSPYGFCRWLVKEDGTPVRQLDEGEYVKSRTLNRINGGVVIFGPQLRSTRVQRLARKSKARRHRLPPGPGEGHLPSPPESCNGSGKEDKSLGNVGRGDRRCTFPNDSTGTGLVWLALSQTLEFTADRFFSLGSE